MSKKAYNLSLRLVAKDAECIIETTAYEAKDLDSVAKILKKKCTEKLSADPLVLVRPPKLTPPTWVPFVKLMAPKAKLEKLKTSSAGAVLVVDNIGDDNRIMILSFGQGHHCIPDVIIEPFFGIIVAVNSIDSEQIKSMNTSTPSSESLRAAIQTGTHAKPEQLALSLDSSILKGITGKVSKKQAENLQYLKGSITGSSSLTLKASITSFDNLRELCLEAYKQSLKDTYKDTQFEWIDNMKALNKHEVESAELNEKLKNALEDRVEGDEPSGELYLSPPEIVDYEQINHYKFTGKLKSDIAFADLEIKTLFELNKSSVDFSIDSLTASYVQSYDSDRAPISKWSIYKCLTFETKDDADKNKYILTDGSWYRVDSSFYDKIKSVFAKAVESGQSENFHTKKLPKIKRDKKKKNTDNLSLEDEDNYNERVAKDSPELISLNRELPDLPDRNKFEVCDLLSRKQELIHVKKCCSSSTLSHLFMQGLNSVFILKEEEDTRDHLIKKIDEVTKEGNKSDASDFKKILNDNNNNLNTKAKVIFALIDSRQKENRGSLPYFSLVTFSEVYKHLRNMNIDVSVLWVTEEGTK